MRFFTFTALVAAALVSAIVAVPFSPLAKSRGDNFVFEIRMTSNTPGFLQVFLDDGAGFREDLSIRANVSAGPAPVVYRLPLPAGTYRSMRFDPLERGGNFTLHAFRFATRSGRVLAELPLEKITAVQQVESLRLQNGALELAVNSVSNDPQLGLTFPTPIEVKTSLGDLLVGLLPRAAGVFAALAAGLFLLERLPAARRRIAERVSGLLTRPIRAVLVVAAAAVALSAYPVVFLGKSFVSPNLGTVLLYDTYPTLPGYQAREVADVKLSDVGAVMWQHVPFSMMQHRALARGELPLWNRYNAAGVPLLAQGQSMFGDPLHLFVVAANGAAWAWDLKYLVAKWLFAAGLGLTVLALGRRAVAGESPDRSPPDRAALFSALLVALAAPFVGFFLYRINHPAFFSLCYAPWPLYCLVRVALARSGRSTALWLAGLLASNLALMNSGTVKEAYMLLLCVNISGAGVILAGPGAGRTRILKLAALAWTGVLFGLITAPISLTFLNTLRSAYTGYNAVSAYQIQPTLLLGAFDEIFYRPLMSQDRVFSPSLNFLLLAGLLYYLATLRLQFAQRMGLALAASSLLPLSLAFGFIPPQWIVKLPFLSNIAHLDNTFSCVLIVLWSVVAGLGFTTAARRLGTAEGRHDLVIGGLLLGALVFGWVAFRQAAHRPIMGPIFTVHQPGQVLPISDFIWKYLGALLVALIALAVLVHQGFARKTVSVARWLLIFVCAAMLLWRHGLQAGVAGFDAFTARPTDRVNFHARSEAVEFVRAAHAREPGRGFGFQGNFFPGWTGVYGLETVHGPDALVNPWLRELVGVSGVERIWDWRLYVDATSVATARPFLDALNVRFYFDMLSKNPAFSQSLTLVKGADLDVYQSATAWPRAFFTDRLAAYDQPAQVIEQFRAAAGKPLALAQRTDRDAGAALGMLSGDLATRTFAAATDYKLTENTTTFSVKARGPGVIVLTEAFWPGDFRAEVNGRKAPILRLNHAFKGILVEQPGDYRVTFRYWPKNFPRNLILCGLGVALLAASLFFAARLKAETPA